jgi:hypothetical protein
MATTVTLLDIAEMRRHIDIILPDESKLKRKK